jgi:citrate lyase subunit beta/citryl-CoA lyase
LDVLFGEAGPCLTYLTLPKAEGLDDVLRWRDRVGQRAASWGLALPRLHVLIETHGALAQVAQIAVLPEVETLDFGLMDFVSAHHGALGFDAMHSPGQFEHPLVVRAKTEIVAAALAHGVVPSHNVCLALREPERVADDARRARMQFGFLRMWSIHPQQIEPIMTAMRPAAEAVHRAGRVLLAAQAAHWGPVDDAGELHDRASYRYSWALLQRAHGARMTLEPAVQSAFFS